MTTRYRSIRARIRAEPDKVKGSRHIATAIPFEDEGDLAPLLIDLRAEFRSACHHAYAWRLGTGERVRYYYSDDGEPSGSAGRPILQHLEGRDLTHIALVVSRIFGGTKLGVGGLIRAYGGAAAAALDAAEILAVTPKSRLRMVFAYVHSNAIQRVLHGAEVTILASDYGAEVTLTIEACEEATPGLLAELRDATAGSAQIKVED